MSWQPSAGLDALRTRAQLLAILREFFASRDVLEVETPLLCSGTVTDPSLTPITSGMRWLQTSPEYLMKRLLAAGSGPIYQVCKAFRAAEAGSRHNPEFTLLEWYRPGFDLTAIMAETTELVELVLGQQSVKTIGYRQLFIDHLDIDPFTASDAALARCAREHVEYSAEQEPRDTWLDLLMSHVIEPSLRGITLVHSYPASQAALARVVSVLDTEAEKTGRPNAETEIACGLRFELYVNDVELANGYQELSEASEQRQRFQRDNAILEARGDKARPVDERLLAALAAGLPDCSGVALGLDRLLMLKLGARNLADVLSFDWSRC